MSEIKWIKISTGMFDDEAIQVILSLPEGPTLLEIWLRLLITAGKLNDNGLVYIKKHIPYTEDMLATVFHKDTGMIKYALSTFSKFRLIDILSNNQILIRNWEKHQNIDGLERIKEQNRIRKQKQREREKLLLPDFESMSRDMSRDVTQQNKNKNKNIVLSKDNTCQKQSFDLDKFIELYHEKCTNLPKVVKLTDDRKRKIKTRLNTYPDPEWWVTVFEKANKSDFCINGKWCNIDWFISNDTNPLKVYEGKYDNKNERVSHDKRNDAKFDRANGWY